MPHQSLQKRNIIPGAKTVRTKSAFLCKPERVTLTDSDGGPCTSETHLAHLRSYKTVRVRLVSHHSLTRCSMEPYLSYQANLRDSSHPKITNHYSFCLLAQFLGVKHGKLGNKLPISIKRKFMADLVHLPIFILSLNQTHQKLIELKNTSV